MTGTQRYLSFSDAASSLRMWKHPNIGIVIQYQFLYISMRIKLNNFSSIVVSKLQPRLWNTSISGQAYFKGFTTFKFCFRLFVLPSSDFILKTLNHCTWFACLSLLAIPFSNESTIRFPFKNYKIYIVDNTCLNTNKNKTNEIN